MSTLSEPLRHAIRFETNYAHHFESLMRINPVRFRTLGDVHCRAFVRHAAQVGDEMRLYTMGSVAYVMFLMHWLGSNFHHDPRYADISAAFFSGGPEETRLAEARGTFMAIATQYIGHQGELFLERIAKLPEHEELVTNTTTSHHKLHDALLDLWQIHGDARSDYPRAELEEEAVASARALNIDSPLGRRLCLVLTFVLGARFHADPLHPWIRDTITKAREKGEPPEPALFTYAKKRMNALLRNSED